MRTTSPIPVYRSTRDTRNAPLWNPRTKELLNVEEDDAGRLAGFRARFGGGFDSQQVETIPAKGKGEKDKTAASHVGGMKELEEVEGRGKSPEKRDRDVQRDLKVDETKKEKQRLTQQQQAAEEEEVDEGWDFGEEDENMLDLISRFGQDEDIRQKDAPTKKKK